MIVVVQSFGPLVESGQSVTNIAEDDSFFHTVADLPGVREGLEKMVQASFAVATHDVDQGQVIDGGGKKFGRSDGPRCFVCSAHECFAFVQVTEIFENFSGFIQRETFLVGISGLLPERN